ncbi:hypothetical protein [Fundidesulfovibrio butyratiphilus]
MFVTKAFAKGSFEEGLRVSKVFQVLYGFRRNQADKLGEAQQELKTLDTF